MSLRPLSVSRVISTCTRIAKTASKSQYGPGGYAQPRARRSYVSNTVFGSTSVSDVSAQQTTQDEEQTGGRGCAVSLTARCLAAAGSKLPVATSVAEVTIAGKRCNIGKLWPVVQLCVIRQLVVHSRHRRVFPRIAVTLEVDPEPKARPARRHYDRVICQAQQPRIDAPRPHFASRWLLLPRFASVTGLGRPYPRRRCDS